MHALKDICCILQLNIVAYDSVNPSIRGEGIVYIAVKRNENKPLFEESSYEAEISSTYPQGEIIVNVTAIDQDEMVRKLAFYCTTNPDFQNLENTFVCCQFVKG